jgi:hypothetical protein
VMMNWSLFSDFSDWLAVWIGKRLLGEKSSAH